MTEETKNQDALKQAKELLLGGNPLNPVRRSPYLGQHEWYAQPEIGTDIKTRTVPSVAPARQGPFDESR